VTHFLSLDTSFLDRGVIWRAVTNSTLQGLTYVLIIGR
jgi:predicted small integral membrane protein